MRSFIDPTNNARYTTLLFDPYTELRSSKTTEPMTGYRYGNQSETWVSLMGLGKYFC